ncbi:MAG: CvpA family protein [Eubacteriales bacterium]|nr:CvpA family protein [Eubacteriales bacterium]
MNIIDGILLFILAISVVYGLYHGFIQSVASLAALGLSILTGFMFGPALAGLFAGDQTISGLMANMTDAVSRVGDYDLASAPVSQVSGSVLDTVLNSVALPEAIEQALRDNIITRAFQQSGLTTVNDYVSNTLVNTGISILSFLACFAAAYLILTLLLSLIRHVFEFPILRQLDWLAGGAFGLVRGAALCYLLVLLIPLVQVIVPGGQFTELLETSALAGWFSNDGLFMRVIGMA